MVPLELLVSAGPAETALTATAIVST